VGGGWTNRPSDATPDRPYAAEVVSLIVDAVRKSFGSIVALDGVSFSVAPGSVFGYLGPNGAGKTTTMRVLLGVLAPDGGEARWRGVPAALVPRRTWGYLPEERGLYSRMHVLDHLVFLARLYGVPQDVARREARAWLGRFRIADAEGRRIGELSKGNQQKVQFVAALLHDPDVLLLDEPFTGLDPVNASLLREAFTELRDAGKTLVFSTHIMESAEALCDAIAILDRGRIVTTGTVRDVRRSTGRQVVRLAVEGDGSGALDWLADSPGITVTRPGRDFTEVVVAAGRDPHSLLVEAQQRGERVLRFEIADPPLERVFIDLVGRPVEDEAERHLASDTGTDETADEVASRTVADRPESGRADGGRPETGREPA
jgi:ABC-2 type transport system ATP-binding protein